MLAPSWTTERQAHPCRSRYRASVWPQKFQTVPIAQGRGAERAALSNLGEVPMSWSSEAAVIPGIGGAATELLHLFLGLGVSQVVEELLGGNRAWRRRLVEHLDANEGLGGSATWQRGQAGQRPSFRPRAPRRSRGRS